MPDSKITALTALTSADPANDMFPIVDVSDTSMAASGTTKRISINNLLAASGTATLASATITGDLTVDTSTLKVDSANNRVGIGTASPTSELDIFRPSGSGITSGISLRTTAGAGGDGSFIKWLSAGTNEKVAQIDGVLNGTDLGYLSFQCGNGADAMAEQYRIASTGLFTWYDGAGGTRMTLNSTGLGVGVVPSTYKLEVGNGGSDTRAVFNPNNAFAIGVKNGSNQLGGWIGSSGNNILTFSGNDGTMKMTIDNTGNVGIGVTPSAWGSGFRYVQAGAGCAYGTNGSVDRTDVAANWYYNGGDKYINATGKASIFQQSGGAFFWLSTNTASGGAGSAMTLNTNMTLDASGHLLVGNSGNPNTARAYFRYDTLTTQPVINSASIVAASTAWSHFIGQSGNGSSITTSNIFIYGNGNIQNINGVYGTISDLRLKENIADARNYLADLLKLRVVKYSLKEEASAVANKLGFIAQEVEQVFPAMVDTDPNDGNKGIKTSVLIPMLVKAIQELTARVQTLETR